MKSVRFRKYSLNGNTFVFVDETDSQALSEAEKSQFAYRATNSYFGIGADNLIILQPCRPKVLAEINTARNYWPQPPEAAGADFIFRMFEPDGTEAFSCGNGLTCMADHLKLHHQLDHSRIMTQVPLETPQVLTVGFDTDNRMNWANLGQIRSVPSFMVQTPTEPVGDGPLQRIQGLKICFREVHPDHPSQAPPLKLSGYLLFTGEPHLVLLSNDAFSDPRIAETLFAARNGRNADKVRAEMRRGSYNSWLVHYIGTYLNRSCERLFPCGINVNFLNVIDSSDTIEYRCFERGIYHETLACGTGAVAASAVARQLGLGQGDTFRIHPHRCRWYNPDAEFFVRYTADGWYLYGRPDLLYEGTFPFGATGWPSAVTPVHQCEPECATTLQPSGAKRFS